MEITTIEHYMVARVMDLEDENEQLSNSLVDLIAAVCRVAPEKAKEIFKDAGTEVGDER